jgi:propanediol dehydratase large subunit
LENQDLLDCKVPLENSGHLERKDPRVIEVSLVSKDSLDLLDHLEIKDHLDQLELMESLELLDLEDHQVLMDMLVNRDWLVQQVLEVPRAKKENVEYLENLDLLDHLDHLENLQVMMLLLFLPCLVKVLVRALIHWPRMSQLECLLQTSPMKNARTWS